MLSVELPPSLFGPGFAGVDHGLKVFIAAGHGQTGSSFLELKPEHGRCRLAAVGLASGCFFLPIDGQHTAIFGPFHGGDFTHLFAFDVMPSRCRWDACSRAMQCIAWPQHTELFFAGPHHLLFVVMGTAFFGIRLAKELFDGCIAASIDQSQHQQWESCSKDVHVSTSGFHSDR